MCQQKKVVSLASNPVGSVIQISTCKLEISFKVLLEDYQVRCEYQKVHKKTWLVGVLMA